jgi:hypothetical protein
MGAYALFVIIYFFKNINVFQGFDAFLPPMPHARHDALHLPYAGGHLSCILLYKSKANYFTQNHASRIGTSTMP